MTNTEHEDRQLALWFIKALAKTEGFTYLPKMRFGEELHELPGNFNDTLRQWFLDLVNRRGPEWIRQATDGRLSVIYDRGD